MRLWFCLHAAETWTLLATDIKPLEAFHMKYQRQILGIHWFYFVSDVDVQALDENLAARRISVFGHIVLLESDVPAHMAL